MRFLLFNAAVVAALIYLLSADRSEFRAAADRLYDTVGRVEDAARDGIERVGSAARDSAPSEAATETAASQDEPREEKGRTRQSEPDPNPERPRRLAAETAPEPVPPAPAPGAAAPSGAPSGGTGEAALVRDLPPVDDPAVAKRRAEVLDGIAALDSAPVPAAPEVAALEVALAEGETLMSPEERLRELYTLAEEMELLFVTKLTR